MRGRDPRRPRRARGASTACTSRSSSIEGLTPGEDHPYEVRLDGELVWPEAAIGASRRARSACSDPAGAATSSSARAGSRGRTSRPTSCARHEHPTGQGIDALRAYALRAARARRRRGVPGHAADARRPDLRRPALAGAQGGARRARAPGRRARGRARRLHRVRARLPRGVVASRRSAGCSRRCRRRWSSTTTRSTPSGASRRAGCDEMNAEPWFDDHIRAGLMAYWVFQHLGNLSPAELAEGGLLRRGPRGRRRRGELLAARMDTEGRQVGHSRWSFARDLGDARLVVIDSRAGREVDARAGASSSRTRSGTGSASRPASRRGTCCSRARCRSCSRPACTTSRPSTRR